jgi:hypothetical protein
MTKFLNVFSLKVALGLALVGTTSTSLASSLLQCDDGKFTIAPVNSQSIRVLYNSGRMKGLTATLKMTGTVHPNGRLFYRYNGTLDQPNPYAKATTLYLSADQTTATYIYLGVPTNYSCR